MKKLKLLGKSGCAIEIIESKSGTYVIKTSSSLSYSCRLEKQAEKQNNFISIEGIHCPIVFNVNRTGGLSNFSMEYISGDKFSDFFQVVTLQDVEVLTFKFKKYFERLISTSTLKDTKTDLLDKFNQIKVAVQLPEGLKNKLDFIFSNLPNSFIPVQNCHGDFTLSNMLFKDDQIYLLDFLDSFIESPLIDMVKIRQDTKFYWSLFIDPTLEDYKRKRAIQVLNYLDKELNDWFESFEWYREWHKSFAALNLMRILPYLTCRKEISFVINCLEEL